MPEAYLDVGKGEVWYGPKIDAGMMRHSMIRYQEAFYKVAQALQSLGEVAHRSVTPWVNEETEKLPGVVNYRVYLQCPQCKEHTVTIMNYSIACYMCEWHRDRIGARRPVRPSVTVRGF